MLPMHLFSKLSNKEVLDYGIKISSKGFKFFETYGVIPSPIVFGKDGEPVGMAAGTTIGIGADGFSGLEAGEIIGKDFFVEQSSAMLERTEAGVAGGPGIDFDPGLVGGTEAPIDLFDAIAFMKAPPGGPGRGVHSGPSLLS